MANRSVVRGGLALVLMPICVMMVVILYSLQQRGAELADQPAEIHGGAHNGSPKDDTPVPQVTTQTQMSLPLHLAADCRPNSLGGAPKEHFKQVETFVGPVSITDIENVLALLNAADRSLRNVNVTTPTVSSAMDVQLVLFALDGTLLNFLRWGRIVNDNDIDLGFFFWDTASRQRLMFADEREAYRLLQRWLFERGLMFRRLTDRDEKKLHDSKKVLKPHTCKHRGQMMQCRLTQSNVIIDWFGAETVFSSLTGLVEERDIVPLSQCRAFAGSFPCPRRPTTVLQQFTLNVGTPIQPQRYAEFSGCALFPKRVEERDFEHVQSIMQTGLALQACGFPNLLSQLNEMSEYFSSECHHIVEKSKRREFAGR